MHTYMHVSLGERGEERGGLYRRGEEEGGGESKKGEEEQIG